MAFSLMNGLSAAGTAIATTAGAYTLEAQKAEAEMEKVKLADELAGVREEKGRVFTKSEREATQGFTGGENVLNRDNALKLANIQADAVVKGHSISAGATIAAANIGASSVDKQIAARAEEHNKTLGMEQKKLDQNKPLIDAETLQKDLASRAAKNVLDARSALDEATKSGDPAKITAAKSQVFNAEYSSKDEVQKVALYQTQAKLAEHAMQDVQARLVTLQDPMKTMTPEGKALADNLQKQLSRLQAEYLAATKAAQAALGALPSSSPTAIPADGAIDLNKYLKPPAPGGLINSPPQ